MSDFRPEDLTDEQSEVLEKAMFLLISAKREAAEMLTRAEIAPLPDGPFRSPCEFCACSDYNGDGGDCQTRVFGPGGSGPDSTCGHAPSDHLET
ncbi:DUF6422 family protein [Streptomyces albogriseolus]|uniref:DUF6422 family protein n=1 Tax=Streptomyces albogriseolus TaxID=1887 RepID=UPI0034605DC1